MGNVAVGDLAIGADGKPTKVVASTDVLTERTCYAVRFDGGVLVADAEHQWQSQIDDHVVVATTEQLRPFVGCASVRNAEPLELLPDGASPTARTRWARWPEWPRRP